MSYLKTAVPRCSVHTLHNSPPTFGSKGIHDTLVLDVTDTEYFLNRKNSFYILIFKKIKFRKLFYKGCLEYTVYLINFIC